MLYYIAGKTGKYIRSVLLFILIPIYIINCSKKRNNLTTSIFYMQTALEYMLINSYKSDMISYMDTHPEDFEEAVSLAVSDKQPYSRRAAWLLWSSMEENDKRVQDYTGIIINSLTSKDDDQQRELLKILLLMELNKDYEDFLFNICVPVWKDIAKKPSVRLTAFKVLVKIAKKQPGLFPEISLLTQKKYMDSLSPNVIKSISKMW